MVRPGSSHWNVRTLLFAPGDDRRKLAKLPACGADAVVIDLEDAVAPPRREEAREATAEALAAFPPDLLAAVRVNSEPEALYADLEAIVCPRLKGVMVPKVVSPDDLASVAAHLDELERRHGLEPRSIRLLALLETPRGITHGERIAGGSERLDSLVFGPGDLALELEIEFDLESPTMTHARAAVVLAARAAGLGAPIDGPYPWPEDTVGLLADTRRSRATGFGGRLLLHPAQVEPVNLAYSELSEVTAARLERAVAHFEAERERGVVSTLFEGEFLDPPVYERMRTQLLEHNRARGAK